MKLADVTLREGDQMPGRTYEPEAKIEAGRALDDLGVTYLQAGFPATGEADRRVVSTLAAETNADVVGLSRALPGDVEATLDADADVVEVFAPLGDHHLKHVLGKTREEALTALREAIDRANEAGVEAHVSLLDGFRTDLEHVRRAFDAFPDVAYVTLADTVGVRTPREVADRLTLLSADVDLSRAGVHFHDDLGVATANVLTAADIGAGKADVSVAGLGERAGNAPLEEVVVGSTLADGDPFGVDPDRIVPTCEAVLAVLDESVPDRKAVLGRDATTHESGLHTAAMLDDSSTFEPYPPERFGGTRRLVFGAGTGRGAARRLLERAGIDAEPDGVKALLAALAEEGPIETDAALELARRTVGAADEGADG